MPFSEAQRRGESGCFSLLLGVSAVNRALPPLQGDALQGQPCGGRASGSQLRYHRPLSLNGPWLTTVSQSFGATCASAAESLQHISSSAIMEHYVWSQASLMIKPVVFVVLSVALVLLNLTSLRQPGSHGFFRFFAFEFLIALVLLNLESWFLYPLSPRQLVSWVLLAYSLVLAVAGFFTLGTTGKPTAGIETTTILVSKGIYKYLRHPLYGSLAILGWGIFVKQPSILGLVLVHGVMFSVFFTARAEEKENLRKFGDDYAAYMKRTKKFIPHLY